MSYQVQRNQQHWALLPFVAGILLGLVVSTVILVRPQMDSEAHISEMDKLKPEGKFSSDFNRFLEELKQRERGIRKLSEDVVTRDVVYYAVMATDSSSAESWKAIRETWGGSVTSKNIDYFVSSERHTTNSDNVITLPVTRQLEIETLQYLCEHKLNATKWFFISYENVYVKTGQFEQFLLSLETLPPEFGYLGKPVRRDGIGGRVCMTGPGSVLSASVLQQLCPKLSQCPQGSSDTAIGECVRSQLSSIECVKDLKFHERFLKFDQERKGSVLDPANKNVFERALTIYPVENPDLMYGLHQYQINKKLSHFQQVVQELTRTLDHMTDLLPIADQKSYNDKVGVAMTEDDIIPWTLISDNQYMSCVEPRPATKLHALWKQELELLSAITMDYINAREEEKYALTKIVTAYWRRNNQLGCEYIIDIETKQSGTTTDYSAPVSRFRVSLVRHYNDLEVNPVITRVDQSQPLSVVVMVTNDLIENFVQFMSSFEEILKIDSSTFNLIAVHMETDVAAAQERLSEMISQYSTKYRQTTFQLIKSPHTLSRSYGLSLVLQELGSSNHLLLLADLSLRFDQQFLTRCRSLPIRGQQVYYPIPFTQADPAMLSATNHAHLHDDITSHAGHWLVNSYAIACLYTGDALAVLKQDEEDAEGDAIPEEISAEDLYNQFTSSSYFIVRNADKNLRKVFSEGKCELDYHGNHHEPCQSLPESYERLYLKTQLSVLLLDHEGEHAHKKY